MTYPKKLACPKCGEPGDQLTTYAYDNGGRHVECDRCFYLGPGEGSILAAIRSHNEHCRAALSGVQDTTKGDGPVCPDDHCNRRKPCEGSAELHCHYWDRQPEPPTPGGKDGGV